MPGFVFTAELLRRNDVLCSRWQLAKYGVPLADTVTTMTRRDCRSATSGQGSALTQVYLLRALMATALDVLGGATVQSGGAHV